MRAQDALNRHAQQRTEYPGNDARALLRAIECFSSPDEGVPSRLGG